MELILLVGKKRRIRDEFILNGLDILDFSTSSDENDVSLIILLISFLALCFYALVAINSHLSEVEDIC